MTEYLIAFFKTLGSLTNNDESCVSDAIAYDEGLLYVLARMGDVRMKVPIQAFDSDPVKAARMSVDQWKAMTPDEWDMATDTVVEAPATLRIASSLRESPISRSTPLIVLVARPGASTLIV